MRVSVRLCTGRYKKSQGWVIRRIRKLRCMVFDAYFTVMNKLGRIIRVFYRIQCL